MSSSSNENLADDAESVVQASDEVVEVSATRPGPSNKHGNTSICWHFFRIKADDDSIAVCKCGEQFSRGDITKGKGNYTTSSLIRHVRRTHKDELKELGEIQDTQSSIVVGILALL